MIGLIIKDFLNLKKQAQIISIIVVIYMMISFLGENVSMLVGMIMLLSAMLPLTALAYDERSGWDKFALTMPVSRREVVASKYTFAIIVIGVASVISFISMMAFDSLDISTELIVSAFILSFCILYISLLLPVAFKLGAEKARYAMFIVAFTPVIVVSAYAKINPEGLGTNFTELNFAMIALISLTVAVVCFVISYMVSIKIYKAKEF
ncbi:MAG: ABC-2 transporter permease [Eubacteriales bacterium]|nr:ABC-2 transporter permease [Eubacteriales bacterium]MDD4390017.1 ABC-2 transporter permease [Eubacteriales bacterium]